MKLNMARQHYTFLLAVIGVCAATFRAGAAAPNALSFQQLQGGHLERAVPQTLAALQGHKTLIAFWRSDCAPCLREMAILPAIASENPALPMALISLQDVQHTRDAIKDAPANMQIFVAQDDGKAVLQAFGNTKMTLPFSVMLHKDGSVCASHYGILGTQKVATWVKQC